MIFHFKYKDNPASEPVKTKASPFRSLDRTRCLDWKSIYHEKINKNEKLSLTGQWSKNG